MWPAFFGAALAGAKPLDDAVLYVILALGALVMRSAGCVINDVWDREIDPQVARTKTRPIAAGELSVKQALFCLAALCGVGLGLLWQFDEQVRSIGFVFAVLIALYPLAKRVTPLPQLVLAATINGGALMAYVAVQGEFTAELWWLYAACACWTMGYDTIYAHQDTRDDAVVGIGSSALFFQRATKPTLAVFYGIMMLCIWQATGGNIVWLPAFMVACAWLMVQIVLLRPHDPKSCAVIFASNAWLGALIFVTILAE